MTWALVSLAASLAALVLLAWAFRLLRAAERIHVETEMIATRAEATLGRVRGVIAPVVALALIEGEWDGAAADAIPGDVWESLHEKGLLRTVGDETGEHWPVITREGTQALIDALGGGRS
jgi:hypothetical protein